MQTLCQYMHSSLNGSDDLDSKLHRPTVDCRINSVTWYGCRGSESSQWQTVGGDDSERHRAFSRQRWQSSWQSRRLVDSSYPCSQYISPIVSANFDPLCHFFEILEFHFLNFIPLSSASAFYWNSVSMSVVTSFIGPTQCSNFRGDFQDWTLS